MAVGNAQRVYLTTTLASGSLRQLLTTATAANTATKNTYSSGVTQQVVPLTANTTTKAVPAVNAAAANVGWKLTAAELGATATAPRIVSAGTLVVTLNVVSDALLGMGSTITAIAYKISSDGVSTEIGRTANASQTIGTTAANAVVNITISAQTFAVGEELQVEVYASGSQSALGAAQSLTWNLGTVAYVDVPAPGVRTRFIVSSSDTATAADALTRTATFPRGLTDSAPAADTLTRQTVLARQIADTAPAADALTRTVTFKRALSDTAAASDAFTRTASFIRTMSDSAPAADVLTRRLTLARALPDAAPASDVFSRQLIYVRQISDNIGATGGGTVIVVKRPVYVFDD